MECRSVAILAPPSGQSGLFTITDLGVQDPERGVHDADFGVHDADLGVHDGRNTHPGEGTEIRLYRAEVCALLDSVETILERSCGLPVLVIGSAGELRGIVTPFDVL